MAATGSLLRISSASCSGAALFFSLDDPACTAKTDQVAQARTQVMLESWSATASSPGKIPACLNPVPLRHGGAF